MHLKVLGLLGLLVLCVACTAAYQRLDHQAAQFDFTRQVVRGTDFLHVVYLNQKAQRSTTKQAVFHVYLEGDGRPWIGHRWPAQDPTTDHSLVLNLMRLDAAPSLYLGRPCYHGLNQELGDIQGEDKPCHPQLWTAQRYSKRVVESMAQALKKITVMLGCKRLVLIGHSGGGALAMLLAEQLLSVAGVVTLAANLDIDAWTRRHGYAPLTGSLNPAQRRPLRSEIFQLHLAGGRDENIPSALIYPTVARQQNAHFLVYQDQRHRCCWESIWPAILERINGY